MAKARKLFTIGYEQTPARAVFDELQRAGVKLVVDVRAIVSSRRPGFSKTQLAAALDERGISTEGLAAIDVQLLSTEAVRALIDRYDQVITL